METIIAGILTGIVGVATCAINNFFQHRKTVALVEYRLLQLEKKVDLHNNAVERLYNAERTLDVHEEKFRVANHRIKDLEDKE